MGWSAHCRHSPIHRGAVIAALKESFVLLCYPLLPFAHLEGRGLPRIQINLLWVQARIFCIQEPSPFVLNNLQEKAY